MTTNTFKDADKSIPVPLRDGTMECDAFWRNPLGAPIYQPKAPMLSEDHIETIISALESEVREADWAVHCCREDRLPELDGQVERLSRARSAVDALTALRCPTRALK